MAISSAQVTPQHHWWSGQHYGAVSLWVDAAWRLVRRLHRYHRRASRHERSPDWTWLETDLTEDSLAGDQLGAKANDKAEHC